MWITCNACSGKGTEITISFDKTYPCKIYKTVPCKVCNPLKLAILFDENVRGLIWVDDNYEPISPPRSPKMMFEIRWLIGFLYGGP